jgi:hypothetical protein
VTTCHVCGFETLKIKKAKLRWTAVFWRIKLYIPMKVKDVSEEQTASCLLHANFLLGLLRHWRWRRYILPKHPLTSTGLHSQKTELFIVSAMRTSNPNYFVQTLLRWWWRQRVPPKQRYKSTWLYCVTFQKTIVYLHCNACENFRALKRGLHLLHMFRSHVHVVPKGLRAIGRQDSVRRVPGHGFPKINKVC